MATQNSASKRKKGSAKGKRPHQSRYTEKTLNEDRQYGLFWYAWLWKILRPLLVLACALVIVGGIVVTGWNIAYDSFLAPVDANMQEKREFLIDSGESVSAIGKSLQEQGLLRNKALFKYIVQFRGLTSSIQYGAYELSPSMNIMEIIDILSSGSATNERTIRIIPGWTVEDIANYLKQERALVTTDEFLALCNQPSLFADESYMLRQGVESGMNGRLYALEGYLAPDTYRIFTNASAQSIIEKLLKQTDKVMDKALYGEENQQVAYDENGNLIETPSTRTFETTLSQEQTLILASVIEREAGKKDDYAKVSAVFHNRLENDMPLQSDATITYVLRVNRLTLSNDELNHKSPYNTYQNKGLPPGPICNPSAAAIEAALHPDEQFIADGYLYFCSKEPESGELAFARTLEEHQKNVDTYRPSWIEYDAKRTQR